MEFIRLRWSFYSNKLGGLRKKDGTDDQVPALIESEVSPKEFRRNWARLIQKIYKNSVTVVPTFGELSICIRPPWASMIVLHRLKPKPSPPVSWVRDLSTR